MTQREIDKAKREELKRDYHGERLKIGAECRFRRGYTQHTMDCMNCRYHRVEENGFGKCVASNFIEPLSNLDQYEEEVRNRDNGLVIFGQQSDRLEWLSNNNISEKNKNYNQ